MIEIKPARINDTDIIVPGSKSYTHRILIAAALSDGVCTIKNALKSEDTHLTQSALNNMGIVTKEKEDRLVVYGAKGLLKECTESVNLENSGTSMRLLMSVAALGKGSYKLTGSKRMGERPVGDLLDSLNQLGVDARSIKNNGCPPVEIRGQKIKGGSVSINCRISSQFLSSLLLIAPYTEEGLDISVTTGPVSKPYVDMTVDIMRQFGISLEREGYNRFIIKGGQIYRSGIYSVEPDCSQAGYFWAAAAISGAKVKVKGVSKDSRQGDIRFTEVLQEMGCSVFYEEDGIAVSGGDLSGVEIDMSDMPDIVPTLAVVAGFARGVTIIKNVAHLKEKESDRLGSVANELVKIGIKAKATGDGLIIEGGHPTGAVIDTYNDHRIAMSFALAGIKVPGIFIRNERCVEKSFPGFWNVFERLYKK